MRKHWSVACFLSLAIPCSLGLVTPQFTAPVVAQTNDQYDAQAAVYRTLMGSAAVPRITKMTLQENYGLATWVLGQGGGTAILRRDNNGWSVVKAGGGAPNAMYLVQTIGMGKNSAIRLMNTHQAQPSKDIPSYCNSSETPFVAAETSNYWVSICGTGPRPAFYVGINKQNPTTRIRLPLSDYSPQGPMFVATNGSTTYILGWSAKGANLTVSKGSTEILREPVLGGLAIPNY